MQKQIEQGVFDTYAKILLESNFQSSAYTLRELVALCKRISRLHEHLTLLSLHSGIPATDRTNQYVKKIKGFACSN